MPSTTSNSINVNPRRFITCSTAATAYLECQKALLSCAYPTARSRRKLTCAANRTSSSSAKKCIPALHRWSGLLNKTEAAPLLDPRYSSWLGGARESLSLSNPALTRSQERKAEYARHEGRGEFRWHSPQMAKSVPIHCPPTLPAESWQIDNIFTLHCKPRRLYSEAQPAVCISARKRKEWNGSCRGGEGGDQTGIVTSHLG